MCIQFVSYVNNICVTTFCNVRVMSQSGRKCQTKRGKRNSTSDWDRRLQNATDFHNLLFRTFWNKCTVSQNTAILVWRMAVYFEAYTSLGFHKQYYVWTWWFNDSPSMLMRVKSGTRCLVVWLPVWQPMWEFQIRRAVVFFFNLHNKRSVWNW